MPKLRRVCNEIYSSIKGRDISPPAEVPMKLHPSSSDQIARCTEHYRLQERTRWIQQAPAPMQINFYMTAH